MVSSGLIKIIVAAIGQWPIGSLEPGGCDRDDEFPSRAGFLAYCDV
jgi:hypothetical protein